MIVERDVFYHEVCIYSLICLNGADMFNLDVGEAFECEISAPGFRELERILRAPPPPPPLGMPPPPPPPPPPMPDSFHRPLSTALDGNSWANYLEAVYHEAIPLEVSVDVASFSWLYYRKLPAPLLE